MLIKFTLLMLTVLLTTSCTEITRQSEEQPNSCIRKGTLSDCEDLALMDDHAICYSATVGREAVEMAGQSYSHDEFKRKVRELVGYLPQPSILMEASEDLEKEVFEAYFLEISRDNIC